jgi:hypothetical protein
MPYIGSTYAWGGTYAESWNEYAKRMSRVLKEKDDIIQYLMGKEEEYRTLIQELREDLEHITRSRNTPQEAPRPLTYEDVFGTPGDLQDTKDEA